MALKKAIKQNDGVTTEYHRILAVTSTVNSHNQITVISYVDEQARTDEIECIIELPYQKVFTYHTDYNENMSVKDAYEYLKSLDVFEGSEDI